jgi:hypothetical protein
MNASMMHRPAPLDSAYLSWTSRAFARLAKQDGVRTNTGFRGVRNFREQTPFGQLFRAIISGATNGTIVMCHPGHVDQTLIWRDPIHRQREEEFAYLASEDLLRDLAAAGLQLARLGEIVDA